MFFRRARPSFAIASALSKQAFERRKHRTAGGKRVVGRQPSFERFHQRNCDGRAVSQRIVDGAGTLTFEQRAQALGVLLEQCHVLALEIRDQPLPGPLRDGSHHAIDEHVDVCAGDLHVRAAREHREAGHQARHDLERLAIFAAHLRPHGSLPHDDEGDVQPVDAVLVGDADDSARRTAAVALEDVLQRATDRGFSVRDIVARVFLLNVALAALAVLTVIRSNAVVSAAALTVGAALVGVVLVGFARGKKA